MTTEPAADGSTGPGPTADLDGPGQMAGVSGAHPAACPAVRSRQAAGSAASISAAVSAKAAG